MRRPRSPSPSPTSPPRSPRPSPRRRSPRRPSPPRRSPRSSMTVAADETALEAAAGAEIDRLVDAAAANDANAELAAADAADVRRDGRRGRGRRGSRGRRRDRRHRRDGRRRRGRPLETVAAVVEVSAADEARRGAGRRDRRRPGCRPRTTTPEPPRDLGPEPSTMAELLAEQDADIRSFKHGDVVEGTVVRIDKDEILVDIGAKSEGVVSQPRALRPERRDAARARHRRHGPGLRPPARVAGGPRRPVAPARRPRAQVALDAGAVRERA